MSDWDDDEEISTPAQTQPIITAGRRKFEDEDAEDEIKDDWEASDEEPEKPTVLVPAKKKGTVKQKIAEKEAEEKRRRELGLDSEDDEEEEEEDPRERRRLEKEAQLKADVENAANLLGTSKLIHGDDPLSKLKSSNPSSKEDWEKFSTDLFNEILKKQSTRPGFDKHFAPHFLKLLVEPLRDVDMRKMSTKLKELAEEKVKKEKEAKKVVVGIQKLLLNLNLKVLVLLVLKIHGDEALDDDLDFM